MCSLAGASRTVDALGGRGGLLCVLFSSAVGAANWPIATYCPLPLGHYLHRRRCPSASHRPLTFLSLLGPTLPLYFPFLSPGRFVPTEPPDCLCFTALCRVHTEEGNFPQGGGGAVVLPGLAYGPPFGCHLGPVEGHPGTRVVGTAPLSVFCAGGGQGRGRVKEGGGRAGMHWKGGGGLPLPPPGRPAYAEPLSP